MSIDDRLCLVERRCSLMMRFGVIALIILGGGAMIGQATAPAPVVEAREIRLRDDAGKITAVLSSAEGTTSLIFKDRSGRSRLTLLTTSGAEGIEPGSGLLLQGADGIEQMELAAFASGRRFRLTDLGGNDAVRAKVSGVRGLESVAIDLLDSRGSELVSISRPSISTERPANRVDAIAGESVIHRPSPIVLLRGPTGGGIRLQVWGDGNPSLDMWDSEKESVTSIPP